MNGDSVDDFLVSAPSLTYSSRLNAGGVWMLYGKTTAPVNIDLNSLGTAGILFGGARTGMAYMLHGSTTLASKSMSSFNTGSAGNRFIAGAPDDDVGFSVCGAGDINGDGREDILISAPGADLNQYFPDAGEIYVVFGTASSRMSDLFLANPMSGTVGYTIAGMSISGFAGIALSR
eukprot:gene36612-41440_t